MKIFVTHKANESIIPRNAKSIKAFKKGEPILLNRDENGYWRDEEGHIYDTSYIRQFSDSVEVVETDPNYKPKKTKLVQVLQGNYGYGWDDLIEYNKDTPYSEMRADYKSYRENEPTAQHRIITRRVPVEESVETNESLGADITDFQRWVDYDMEHYKRISNKTMKAIKDAGLSVVKDQYGEYEVIADAKVESCGKKNRGAVKERRCDSDDISIDEI